MVSLKRLLVLVVAVGALVGMGVPAAAEPAARPSRDVVASGRWGPLVPVPIPKLGTDVPATAISDRGHVAVAYRDTTHEVEGGEVPGYVIVRSPEGAWGAPHQLNPPNTRIVGVQLAFDAYGNLTAAWSSVVAHGAPERTRFTVASKPAGRAWGEHVRAGRNHGSVGEFMLSVAPSGKAVVFWWQSRERVPSQIQYRFAVRLRTAANAPWDPVHTVSRFTASRNPVVDGDVVINSDGTGMAAWMVCRDVPHGQSRCVVRRSRLMRWRGRWSTPRTMADGRLSGDTLELASTPAGFTVITWARPDQNAGSETVVAVRTTTGIWSRDIVAGLHGFLAVGPHGKVVMVKDMSYPTSHPGLQITWRSNRFGWRTDTLAPPWMTVEPLAPSVDATGQIFVPWFNVTRKQSVMSTHLSTWRNIGLWLRTQDSYLAAAAVTRNGRAVAVRTVSNAQHSRTAVAIRVFRPG